MNVIERLPVKDSRAENLFGPPIAEGESWEKEIGRIRNADGLSGLDFWMQAGSAWLGSHPTGGYTAWQDRWKEGYLRVAASATIPPVVTDGGQEAFQLTAGVNSIMYSPEGTLVVNPTAFSYLLVVLTTGNGYVIGSSSGGAMSPAVTISATGLAAYVGSTSGALAGTKPNAKCVIGVTFDTIRGTAIRVNGVQVAADASRIVPPSDPTIRFFGTGNSSTNLMAGLFHGGWVYNVNLSAPENLAYTARVEAELMARFNITPA